ncbi:MAG: hypothetical protein OXI53_04755 [Nitrospira sp.]|nr:hypothetical protein [Nitrospira sp.]MDE0404601.1 hypothetical protein [Nitrospira sp.]MDE0486162.1 hypothetical protein [Nitrospira sp.]
MMQSHRQHRLFFFLLATSWAVFAPSAWANDTEGLFAGVRFGHELAEAEFVKNVRYNTGVLPSYPDGSEVAGSDRARDGFNAFSANLGYRVFLSDRAYLSGELEGAVYSNAVQGFMEGTYTGHERPIPAEHVFPGAWKVNKNHSLGFNARLGYVPQGFAFLGEGRSVYLISGVQWLDATFEVAIDNFGVGEEAIRGVTRKKRDATPWLIGGGLEFGSSKNRVDVRIQYSSWSMDRVSGDGATAKTAYVLSTFDVDEVGISVGYTRSFSLVM